MLRGVNRSLSRWCWLLLLSPLSGCAGDSLEAFSSRELRMQMRPSPKGENAELYSLQVELVRREAEVGCLRLRDGVKVTLNGQPLKVYKGSETPDPDGPCGAPAVPPVFSASIHRALFFEGEPRNAVLEVIDGEERITAEYVNFFSRHSFARREAPLPVKPGQEVFLAWDPPTDDLAIIQEVAITGASLTKHFYVPARPGTGGLSITVPESLPAGAFRVVARASDIPTARCEGVAVCTGWSGVIVDRGVDLQVQP
ncbi:hypothetical protein P2318_31405 [Myxococcaceae bacterium GXIMD 01537]